MLKIESIQNGIVIDHIPAGKGMDIYKLLELDSQKQSIALLQSVRSEKYGCKDLIKIEGLTEPERLEVLGYLNDGVTLIVIRDGKVVKKYHPVPPRTLKNVIKCKNPRCITSTEANCEHIFKLSSSGKYRCIQSAFILQNFVRSVIIKSTTCEQTKGCIERRRDRCISNTAKRKRRI